MNDPHTWPEAIQAAFTKALDQPLDPAVFFGSPGTDPLADLKETNTRLVEVAQRLQARLHPLHAAALKAAQEMATSLLKLQDAVNGTHAHLEALGRLHAQMEVQEPPKSATRPDLGLAHMALHPLTGAPTRPVLPRSAD